MGYKNSMWAREQLRYLKGQGANAAKVMIMAMAEIAGNDDHLWYGQVSELFENCGVADRTGREGFQLLKVAGLVIRVTKGNQFALTEYRLCTASTLSEPASLAGTEKVNRRVLQVNRRESTSEPARIDSVYKEEQSTNGHKQSSTPTPEKPEWLSLLEKEVPATQKVRWKKRWSELLLAWWAKQDQDEPQAMRVARSLVSHDRKYKDYNLTFQNWYESEGNRTPTENGQRAPPTRATARSDPKDFQGQRW